MPQRDNRAAASLDSLEGLGVFEPPGPPTGGVRAAVLRLVPGLSIVSLVAMAAAWLADHYHAPILLFALLLGMSVNFARQDRRFAPGLDFSTRTLLRLGVALLGARITLGQLSALGGEVVLLVGSGVAFTILGGLALARALRLRPSFGVLTGGAVAICGASAALALAASMPPSPTRERETLLTVVGVTALSTLAMILYPLIATALGLSATQTGVLLGATIHDVAQVVGAGYGVSQPVGDTATIVKLYRVALLLPVVLVVTLAFNASSESPARLRRTALVPGFLIGFAALVGLNSMGVIPAGLSAAAAEGSRALLVVAIAAVGVKTAFGDIFKVGLRALGLILAETAVLLGFMLAAVQAL